VPEILHAAEVSLFVSFMEEAGEGMGDRRTNRRGEDSRRG
jgi:hypothetical protein